MQKQSSPFFNNSMAPEEFDALGEAEYSILTRQADMLEQVLRELLPVSLQPQFYDYIELQNKVLHYVSLRCFLQGYQLGAESREENKAE